MSERPSDASNPALDPTQRVESDDVKDGIETTQGKELKDGDLREEIASGEEGSDVRASLEEAERTDE